MSDAPIPDWLWMGFFFAVGVGIARLLGQIGQLSYLALKLYIAKRKQS